MLFIHNIVKQANFRAVFTTLWLLTVTFVGPNVLPQSSCCWTWNASCRRTWRGRDWRGAAPWGGRSAPPARWSCARSPHTHTPASEMSVKCHLMLTNVSQMSSYALQNSHLRSSLLVSVVMGRSMDFQTVGLQRTSLGEWFLTMVTFVRSHS